MEVDSMEMLRVFLGESDQPIDTSSSRSLSSSSLSSLSSSLPENSRAVAQCIQPMNMGALDPSLWYYYQNLKKCGSHVPEPKVEEEEEGIGGPLSLCPICYTDKAPNLVLTLRCGHTYCRRCLQEHVYQSMQQGRVCDLRCPDPNCEAEAWTALDVADVFAKATGLVCQDGDGKALGLEDMVHRYKYFKMKADAGAVDKRDVKACGDPACDGLIFLRDGPSCRLCGRLHCNDCRCLHMNGETCKQATKRTKQEQYKRTDKYARRRKMRIAAKAFLPSVCTRLALVVQPNVKRCPGCDKYIYKYYGCPHMHCPSCRTDFCWICLNRNPYSSNHCRFAKVTWPVSLLAAATFSAVYAPVMFLPWLGIYTVEKLASTDHESSTQIWHYFYFFNERIAMCPF